MLLVFLIFGGAMYALGSFAERTVQRMVQYKRETKSATDRLEENLAQAINNVDSEINRRIDRLEENLAQAINNVDSEINRRIDKERQDLDRRIDFVIEYQNNTACECKGRCNSKKTEA
jgi:gas vesicle protein